MRLEREDGGDSLHLRRGRHSPADDRLVAPVHPIERADSHGPVRIPQGRYLLDGTVESHALFLRRGEDHEGAGCGP